MILYFSIFFITVFLSDLSHQRDRTVPHYTVCDRIFKFFIVTFTVTLYPVTRTVTVNVTFSVTDTYRYRYYRYRTLKNKA